MRFRTGRFLVYWAKINLQTASLVSCVGPSSTSFAPRTAVAALGERSALCIDWPAHPGCAASYPLPVLQARVLLSASFRFHLAVDTLAVQLTLPRRGLSPPSECALPGAPNKRPLAPSGLLRKLELKFLFWCRARNRRLGRGRRRRCAAGYRRAGRRSLCCRLCCWSSNT